MIELLINKGYKPFRKVGVNYIPCDNYNNFSSMVVGGLHVLFVKDNDFNNPIIYGLNEGHKPPTLVKPRPKIQVLKNYKETHAVVYNNTFDDSMNLCLLKESHEDIYNALFDSSIVFKYDLR